MLNKQHGGGSLRKLIGGGGRRQRCVCEEAGGWGIEVETGRRAKDGGDKRPRTMNTTINYKLNGYNRF